MSTEGHPANHHVGPAFHTAHSKWAHMPAGTPRLGQHLKIVVGVDHLSAGVSIWSWRHTGGHWPEIRLEGSWRWRDIPLTTEECLLIAYNAIRECASEQGIQLSQ